MNPSTQLSRKERELEAARKISEALFQHLSVEDLVEQGLKIALDVLNCQAGCVLLANSETKELVFSHVIGDRTPKIGTAFPWTHGIAGTVFATEMPIVSKDAKADRRHFPEIDHLTGFHTQDMIAVPLKRWEGHSIGVLEVMNKRDGQLNHDDVAILTIIGAFTALSIEQARLFQEAKLAEVARILGNIGHDVKNMLMPVLCGTSLLKDELNEVFADLPTFDPNKGQATHQTCLEVIGMVANNTKRIQERVKEIADCVKGLTSPPQFAPCKLQHVVASVFDTLMLVAQGKDITLLHEGISELPEIYADESRLFNAFYNLVNNAIAEVSPGGSITINGEIESSGKTVHVSVSDTGRGMPAEIRDTIFTSRVRSRKRGGTGLGTKIVKDVIEAHSGVIAVESELNVGAIFHIHLPMEGSADLPLEKVSS